jgi:hypothetical protein
MKKSLIFLLLITCLVSFFSCSINIEKRRYRPGYHTNIVQKNYRTPFHASSNNKSSGQVITKEKSILPIEPYKETTFPDSDQQEPIPVKQDGLKKKWNDPKTNIRTTEKKISKKDDIKRNKTIHDLKKAQSRKGKIIAAWILGALGIIFGLCSIAGFFVGYIGAILGGGLLGLGALFGIIALIVRFTKSKKESEEIKKEKLEKNPYKPVDAGFVNASFIFAIVTASVALVGFILSFFVYPIGTIGWIFCLVAALASVLVVIFGFRAKRDDKGIKPKLTIALGFLAFILAIVGMILLFV